MATEQLISDTNNIDLTLTSPSSSLSFNNLLSDKQSVENRLIGHHIMTRIIPTSVEASILSNVQQHRPSGSNMVATMTPDSQSFHIPEGSCWLGRIEQEAIASNSKRSHEEDVYEDLCYVTLRSNNFRSRDSIVSTPLSVEGIQKRDYCIKELVETEKNYCEALGMIIDHFVQPLSKVMADDYYRIIFNNIKALVDLHSKLYQELYRVVSNDTQLTTYQANPLKSIISTVSAIPTLPITGPAQHSPDGGVSPSTSPSGSSSSSTSNKGRSPNLQSMLSNSAVIPIQTPPSPSFEKIHLSSTSMVNGRFSNCFLNLRNRFLIYGEYCANLAKAQQLLDDICSQDDHINQWVVRCQNKANQGRFKLRDLLSLPMQRILKYHLLLGELIRNTPEDHDDYQNLKRAYEAMLDIGAYINEVKRDTETLEIIRDVQRSIVDLSMPDNYELKDYGRLIKDGEVKMRSHDDNRMRLKNRYIFIFDKVMLMCKTIRGLQYSYKEAIILEEYKLEEMATCSPISKLTKSCSAGWSLVHIRTKQPYTFYVKNEEIKRKWLDAIERAQENVHPKQLSETDHQFSMSTVPVATRCASCTKLLKGTWYQGYLCYVCNVAVHKACIPLVKSCGQSYLSNQFNQISNNIATNCNQTENIGKLIHSNVTYLPPPQKHLMTIGPPTPTKRILVKANVANVVHDQLKFEQNDTIIVYANQGTSWYGRNIRTGEEGSFSNSLVTELITDSPASSSIDSPTCATIRFSYDDPIITHSGDISQTLPRKFPIGSSSSSTPSPQSILVPVSPTAASTSSLTIHNNNSDIFFASTDTALTSKHSGSESESSQMSNPTLTEDGNLRLFFGNGFNLEEYAWFAGSMDRETAQTTLKPLPNGSFLVRISPKQKNNYAISINYKGHVEHMRVQVTYMIGINPTTIHHHSESQMNPSLDWIGPGKPTHFYLSERRYFRTIVDLVRWYELNSLSESFNMVNTQLLLPYKKAYCHQVLGHAIALYAFSGTSSAASSFLSLRKGDRVTVLSRAAEEKGWWKGQIGDRIGYFPFKYVTPTTNSLKVWFDLQTSSSDENVPTQQANTAASISETFIKKLNEDNNQLNIIPMGSFSTVQMTELSTSQQQLSSPNKISPSSITSSSSTSTSSATTLSSPVNSDTLSTHSRQASSDAGIDIAGFIGENLENSLSAAVNFT